MSLLAALDTILVVFKVLPTLMHRDTDTTHKYTTRSHVTDIGPNSPRFILSLLTEETTNTTFVPLVQLGLDPTTS